MNGDGKHIVKSIPIAGLVIMLAVMWAFSAFAARAADLGDACCADLEERIAELEATTARKGNRKVSLTISGYVAQEITLWNDGGERNVYLHDLGPTQATHVKFNGQAQIAPGWTAGYLMRIQNLDANPFGRDAATGRAMNQFDDDFNQGLNVQMSYWYLQSKDLGKLSVGKLAHAAKSAAMFTDQSGTQVIDNYTFLGGFPQFIIRSDGNLVPASLTWGQLAYCYAQSLPLGGDCNGLVMNGVRFDAPVFAGFSASASWGEDDFWEIALRYAGQAGGFKTNLAVGYSELSDENTSGPSVSASKNSDVFQAGGYVEHIDSGLFVHAAYGHEDNNNAILNNGRIAPESHHWYVKGGIRRKWSELGTTIVYADYAEYIDQIGPAALALGISAARLARYGAGIAQEIDAAAMTVYVKAQRFEADATGFTADLDSLELVSVGALISF